MFWKLSCEINDEDNIIKLACKVCSTYLQQIRVEVRKKSMRWWTLESLLKYDGVSYAHKRNVDNHVKSNSLYDWVKKTFQENITASPAATEEKNHKTLKDIVSTSSNVANYRRLFVTAFHIGLKEKPLSDFQDLIELQLKNSLKFLQESHEKVSPVYRYILADTLKRDI